MVLLRSIKTKIETLATVHKPTVKGLTLNIGVGIGVSLALTVLLTYLEIGSLYQSAEATLPRIKPIPR